MLKTEKVWDLVERVAPIATAHGLTSGHVHFEIVPSDTIQLLAAHGGLPVRYSHWSFGKTQQRLKTAFDYRLTQIYELVIHSNPTYAFIDETVTESQALLIVAHVLAHADFFQHHRGFSELPKDMVSLSSRHHRRLSECYDRYGAEAVETLVDAGHILADFSGESLTRAPMGQKSDDVLGFLVLHAPYLEDWERQILEIIWQEARYFWPQQMTKVANEGYATFIHTSMIREMSLSAEESWETARLNAQIVQANPPQMNPYRLGYALFKQAYLLGGMSEVQRARDLYDDVGLVRAYFSESLAEQAGLAVYREREPDAPPRYKDISVHLIRDLERAGLPRVTVESDASGLILRHLYDGRELDYAMVPEALKAIAARLWKGPVTLYTVRQNVPYRALHDGTDFYDQSVS